MTEGPHKLPEGWRWVRLGEMAREIRSGFAFRKKNPQEGDVLHLRPYNIGDDGELQLVQQFFVPRTALPSGWSSLKPGDVLFNNTNSVELVGKSALVREELKAAFSNHITLIRVDPVLSEGAWLALSLNALRRQGFFAQRCNKWIGQAGYNTEMLQETPIPLPPLAEQRRIVARIEELMARVREARRLRQQAREDAERLWQSVLAETFPRPGSDLPQDWRWVRLGEVCSEIRSGFAFRKKGVTEGNLLHLRPYNINEDGTLDLTQRFVVPAHLIPKNAIKALYPGDVLFNNTNSVELVGKTALVTEHLEAAFSNHITLLRPESFKAEGAWIALALQALWRRGFFANICNKWIGQAGINTEIFHTISIPLPPLPEQRRIVARLDEVRERIQALKKAQEDTEARLKDLERSILDKAFRGEL